MPVFAINQSQLKILVGLKSKYHSIRWESLIEMRVNDDQKEGIILTGKKLRLFLSCGDNRVTFIYFYWSEIH